MKQKIITVVAVILVGLLTMGIPGSEQAFADDVVKLEWNPKGVDVNKIIKIKEEEGKKTLQLSKLLDNWEYHEEANDAIATVYDRKTHEMIFIPTQTDICYIPFKAEGQQNEERELTFTERTNEHIDSVTVRKIESDKLENSGIKPCSERED